MGLSVNGVEVMGSLSVAKKFLEQYQLLDTDRDETQEPSSKTKHHFLSKHEQDQYTCPKTTLATSFSCSKNPLERDYITRQIRPHRPSDVPPLKNLTSVAWPVLGLSSYVIHLEVPENTFSEHELKSIVTTIKQLNDLIPQAPLTHFTWSSALTPEYRPKAHQVVLSQFPDSPESSFVFENEANLVHEIMHGVYGKLKIAQDPRWNCLYWLSLAHQNYEIVDDSNFLWGSSDKMGHPFDDPDELFASAGYAYQNSAHLLRDFILNQDTPESLKLFGKLVWCYFRDQIFSGQVFTKNGEDPFAQESFDKLWQRVLASEPLFPILPLIETSQHGDALIMEISAQVLERDFDFPLDEYGATALLDLARNDIPKELQALAPLRPQIMAALLTKNQPALESVNVQEGDLTRLKTSLQSWAQNLFLDEPPLFKHEAQEDGLLEALTSLYQDVKTKDPTLAITALSLLTAFSKGNSLEGRSAHFLAEVGSDPSISLRIRAQALLYLQYLSWKGYHVAIRNQLYKLAESPAWGIRLKALNALHPVPWKNIEEQQKLLEIVRLHLQDPEDEVARHAFSVANDIAKQSNHPLASQAEECVKNILKSQWENLASSSEKRIKKALTWLPLLPEKTPEEIETFFTAVQRLLKHPSAEIKEAAKAALYQSEWGHHESEAQALINELN